jgi:carboxypeptidase C (cathepsin A)
MPEPTEKAPSSQAPPPREHIVSTDHSITVGGDTLEYTVTCGTLLLRLYNETPDTTQGARRVLLHRLHAQMRVGR